MRRLKRQLRQRLRSSMEHLRFSHHRRLRPPSSQQRHHLQSSSRLLHLHRPSSRKSWHPPTVIDALYADFSADSEEIDFSLEELDSAMQEMEEEYSRDEKANNAVTSREVFVTIGTAMDEDQPGRAPPTALEKGKGPLIATDDDHAKVMPPP